MDADTIKSFLVDLGFKVDEKGLKRFVNGVNEATKIATEFAQAMTAAAAATTAAVVKVSSEFEDLYYASQRLRSSAENIKAFDYGISQMGGSAQEARASLEGLASFLRSNPGGEGFISSLGVQTRQANGTLRDTTDIMRDLGDQFRQMPYYLAKVRANFLGIDEKTLQALIRGTDLWSQRYRDIADRMGVDFDKAAEASTRFMQSVRDLRAQLEILFYKVILSIQEKASQGLKRLANVLMGVLTGLGRIAEMVLGWIGKMDEATDGWSTTLLVVVGILSALLAVVGPAVVGVLALVTAIGLLIDDFTTWKEGGKSLIAWDQWSDEIDAAIAGLGDFGAALGDLWTVLRDFVSWIGEHFGEAAMLLIKQVFTGLGDGLTVVADLIRIVTSLLRGDWDAAWKAAGKTAKDTINGLGGLWDTAKKMAGSVVRSFNGETRPDQVAPTGPSAQARAAAIAGRSAANDNAIPRAVGAMNDAARQALNFFQRHGWTQEQAAGIVANLKKESSLRTNAVGDGGKAYGIAQWHPDRQANFKRWSGKDIRESTLAEQLAFVHYELTRGAERAAGDALRKATSARQAGGIVSSKYERPANGAAEAIERGASAERLLNSQRLGQDRGATVVNIQSKTDVNIKGSDNAREIARHAEAGIDRANSDLVRNTRGAVR